MRKAENVNAPWLGGWLIGAAAGLVAFAVLIVVGDFDFTPAAAIGIVVALLAGLILGMPWGAGDKAPFEQASAPVAPVATPRAAEAKPETIAASFVSAPQPVEADPVAKPAAAAKPAPKAKAAPKAAAKPKAAAAPKAEAKPKAEPKPKAAKPAKPAGPERLTAPRKGKADDLKEIEGIGPALEKLVNSMGFYHFDQIAKWSDADVALVDAEMKTFKGRITRDKWVAQAKIIVTEGLEAFRERAKTNNY
jgi:predicted flap endonuclease-1-like 5' DNA nuclease